MPLFYPIWLFPVFRIDCHFALGNLCFFVSEVLEIFTVSHLLSLSTATSIWFSSFNLLLYSFPEKSIWIFGSGSVKVFNFPIIFSGFGIVISYRMLYRVHILSSFVNVLCNVEPFSFPSSANFQSCCSGMSIVEGMEEFFSIRSDNDFLIIKYQSYFIDKLLICRLYPSNAMSLSFRVYVFFTPFKLASVVHFAFLVLECSMKSNSAFLMVSSAVFPFGYCLDSLVYLDVMRFFPSLL